MSEVKFIVNNPVHEIVVEQKNYNFFLGILKALRN